MGLVREGRTIRCLVLKVAKRGDSKLSRTKLEVGNRTPCCDERGGVSWMSSSGGLEGREG